MNTHDNLSNLTNLTSAVSLGARGTAVADNPPTSKLDLTSWQIDPGHSSVGFTVPHMVVSEVDGRFSKYTWKVLLDEQNPVQSRLEFTADVGSIETGNADRDQHLVSPDFFDAAKFPQIAFKSVSIRKAGERYEIIGDLTIRDVTKRVTLGATLSDTVQSPWGQSVRAARVTGSIDRRDFGLRWNKALDKGGVLVGEKVAIDVKLELTK